MTNLYHHDRVDRLTDLVCKQSATRFGNFCYQLGQHGNRSKLTDSVISSPQTFSSSYDTLYRLTNETTAGWTPLWF